MARGAGARVVGGEASDFGGEQARDAHCDHKEEGKDDEEGDPGLILDVSVFAIKLPPQRVGLPNHGAQGVRDALCIRGNSHRVRVDREAIACLQQ